MNNYMSFEDFLYEWNKGCTLTNEDQSDEVLQALMSLILETMKENCGDIRNFDFVGNKGHIQYVN